MADGDRQLAFTTGAVPTSVQVSGPDRVTPKTVNASFDGTGAAGPFLPCLIITGRTGIEVARVPAPQVAAGASAEVSWFPHVGVQRPADVTQAPFAALRVDTPQTVTGANIIEHLDMAGSFETSDDSIFAQTPVPGIFGNPNGLGCLVNGTYLVCHNYLVYGGTAGANIITYFTGIHGNLSVWQTGRSGAHIGDTWDTGSPSDGGAPPFVHTSFSYLYGLRKGSINPAPGYISPYGRLASGADVTIDAQVTAYYLGPFAGVGL